MKVGIGVLVGTGVYVGSGRADITGVGIGASLPEKDITMAMIAMTPISAAPPPSRKAR